MSYFFFQEVLYLLFKFSENSLANCEMSISSVHL